MLVAITLMESWSPSCKKLSTKPDSIMKHLSTVGEENEHGFDKKLPALLATSVS